MTYKNTLPVLLTKYCQTHEFRLISISRADFSFHLLSPAKADNRAGGACAPLPPQSPLAFRAVRTCKLQFNFPKKTNNQPIYYSDVLVIRKSVLWCKSDILQWIYSFCVCGLNRYTVALRSGGSVNNSWIYSHCNSGLLRFSARKGHLPFTGSVGDKWIPSNLFYRHYILILVVLALYRLHLYNTLFSLYSKL